MSVAQLAPKFQNIAREGQALCLTLERGQAATPLSDHIAGIAEQFAREPFTAALVATDARARAQTLAWLLGDAHGAVSTHVGARAAAHVETLVGVVEIHLSERGYTLETGHSPREEFDSLDALLNALHRNNEAADTSGVAAGDAIRVSLAHASGTPGATLLLPADVSDADGASLTSTLISQAHLLIAAAAGEARPDDSVLARLAPLAGGIGAVLPVIAAGTHDRAPNDGPPNNGAQNDGPPNDGWTRALTATSAAVTLAVARTRGESASLNPFARAAGELQTALKLAACSRRLQLAIDALADRYDRDLRQAQARRAREERALRPESTAEPNANRPYEQAKNQAQEEITLLGKSTADRSRRNLLPDAPLARALAEPLKALRTDDLERETGTKSVRLSLASTFQDHLERTLRKALREELTRDLSTVRDGLEALQRDLEARLEASGQGSVRFALAPPSESDIWSRIGELVTIEIKYRGEMPRRGFFQRLGEGRRAVFAVMMILSLVGSMVGSSMRGLGIIGVVCLLMFIGVVIFTYRSWKQEDAEKLEGEIDRVREQLQQEGRRVASEVQREKQTRISDFLDQTRRTLVQRLDDLQREGVQRTQDDQNVQRERARARIRTLDQQLRELQALGTQVNRLRSDAAALVADTARTLNDFGRRPASKP
jgi:hypothetical protein